MLAKTTLWGELLKVFLMKNCAWICCLVLKYVPSNEVAGSIVNRGSLMMRNNIKR